MNALQAHPTGPLDGLRSDEPTAEVDRTAIICLRPKPHHDVDGIRNRTADGLNRVRRREQRATDRIDVGRQNVRRLDVNLSGLTGLERQTGLRTSAGVAGERTLVVNPAFRLPDGAQTATVVGD